MLCTRRVLTMERIGGLPWPEAQRAPDDIRTVWPEVICRYVFGTFNREGLFNGDPHPGNYRFHADGSVTFLDYDCVKEFTAEAVENARRVVFAALGSDAGALRAELVRQHVIEADDDTDPDRLHAWLRIGTLRSCVASRSRSTARSPSTPCARPWILPPVGLPAAAVQPACRLRSPHADQPGSDLRARRSHPPQSWRATSEEFWHDGPPSTALGRLDAAFRAARAA